MKLSKEKKAKGNSKDCWNEILSFKGEKDEIRHEAQILMFRFLSEVDRYLNQEGNSRKALAKKMNISASYLTQVYRGNKPLNFETVARFQKALDIKFQIRASRAGEIEVSDFQPLVHLVLVNFQTTVQFNIWKNPEPQMMAQQGQWHMLPPVSTPSDLEYRLK